MKSTPFSKNSTGLFAFLLFSALGVVGQTNPIPTINQKQEHIIKSKINETDYHLSVSLPQHYSPNDTIHYPVLYLLDGGLAFPIAHSARTGIDIFGGLENVIIVGIEYQWEQSLVPWFSNRTRDYTPTKDAAFEKNPAYLKTFGLTEGSLTSGAASIFLNVIRKEIIPLVDKKYRTTGERGISGHSFGGLFAGYCLFSATDIFSKFGINSPSFWWNNMEMFKMEKAFSEHHTSLPVQVFMSVGNLEGNAMTPVMTAFADALKSRNYKDLKLTTQLFEDENHMSVVPAMISRTLRVLYGVKKK
jgi:predicted alpha/beta superfamily hydrolase